MHVDALTLAALADELRAELVGARVEDVIQPTPHAVALQCWGGGRTNWLLASAHPQLARMHLLDRKPQKLAAEPPAFVMLLRKHLEGARVVAFTQPRWERLLEIGFARGGGRESELPAHGGGARGRPANWLVVEIMGRLSNIILRDDAGTILGALRLVGAKVNRYRTIAPNEPYRPPPPQTRLLAGQTVPRLPAENVSAQDLRVAADDLLAAPANPKRPASVATLLAGHLLGFSQELGREVAARALGQPDAALVGDLPWEELAREAHSLAALPATVAWRPTLVLAAPTFAATRDADGSSGPGGEGPEVGDPVAFAVCEPRQYAGYVLRLMPSVSALLAAYYRRVEWRDAVEGAKGDLRRRLAAQRDRCVRKAEVLRAELAGLAEANRLREEAEVLLAFQAEVPPRAASFTIENPFADAAAGPAPSLTIALDAQLSPVANANRRFARYHKLRRAAAQIPPQIEANALELARIDQFLTDLALAETAPEIALVHTEVAEAGYLGGRRGAAGGRGSKLSAHGGGKGVRLGKSDKPGKSSGKNTPIAGMPLRRQSADGFMLLVGKNSRQNEEVTFRQAAGSDLWLHARGVPGAHVIVKSGGRAVPESTLREAAALAAYYSQARTAGSVAVDYTEQRYVRHMKGGGPGMVVYERERTLNVAPDSGIDD
jgi:predicted ribosome quality control (RQC) complex YloA/Tae2 family protein